MTERGLPVALRDVVDEARRADLDDAAERAQVRDALFSTLSQPLPRPAAQRPRTLRPRTLRPRMLRRAAAVGGGLALAAAATLTLIPLGDDALEMRAVGGEAVTVGEWVSAHEGDLTVSFSDASQVVLDPDSDLMVPEVDARGARVQLAHGRLRADITHRADTSWRFEAGPFDLQIVGTAFETEWRPEEAYFALRVTEGEVAAHGPVFDARPVRAGQELEVWLREERFEMRRIGAERATPPVVRSDEEPASGAERSEGEATSAATRRGPDPMELARAGRFQEAVDAARRRGVRGTLRRSSPAERVVLGDAARHVGELSVAERAYRAALGRRGVLGARAAFGLARVALERGGQREAMRWLRACLQQAPRGPLAREARGRLMALLEQAGDREGARREAERYLELYPEGPQRGLAERLRRR